MGDTEEFSEWVDQSIKDSEVRSAIYKLQENYEKAVEGLKKAERSLAHLDMHQQPTDGLQEVAGNGHEWVKQTLKELGEM